MKPTVDFYFLLITDRHQLPEGIGLVAQVEKALEGGVRAVQLREKDLTAAELYPLAEELRTLTRRFDARLLINDRIDVALAVDADGVHLGGQSLPVSAARKLLGPDRLLGVSTHHLSEIATAAANGASYVSFGPVFYTASKAPYGDPAGIGALQQACADAPLPVFALGGITAERLSQIETVGCRHAAAIGAVLAATDATAAARPFTDWKQS